jgi:hypothetical protein
LNNTTYLKNSQIFIFWAVQCLKWRPSISPFIQVLYVLEWQFGKYGGFQLCGHCWVVIVDLGLDELVAWVLGQLNLRLKARSRELAPPWCRTCTTSVLKRRSAVFVICTVFFCVLYIKEKV